MKSAKEMFEQLGYFFKKKNGNIQYHREDMEFEIYITFIIGMREIEIIVPSGYHEYFLSLKELQAINKQVEELWGGNNA